MVPTITGYRHRLGGVGVGDAQQRLVVALRGEVRHRQDVTNALRINRKSRGSSAGVVDNSCVGRARQATNHGSNAQGEKIFSHE